LVYSFLLPNVTDQVRLFTRDTRNGGLWLASAWR